MIGLLIKEIYFLKVVAQGMPKRVSSRKNIGEELERGPMPDQLSIKSYKKTSIAFLVLVFILLLTIGYVSFAKAIVTVTARATPVEAEIRVDVRMNPAQGEVEGEVKSIILEGESIEEISGEVQEVSGVATGTVKIISEITRPQTLVATTRLLSADGVLFRLKKRVTVPAKGQVRAEVYADQSGVQGDIGPTRFTIPGLNPGLQKLVYATSEAPMTGGLTKRIGVSQGDIDRALSEIEKSLLEQGMKEIANKWSLGVGNAELYQKKIVSWTADQKVGGQAKKVTVKARVLITGVRYDREMILALSEAKLKEKAKEEEDLKSVDREGLTLELEASDAEAGTATIKANLKGKLAISENSKILDPEQLVGLTKGSAEEYLRGFHAVENAEVKIRPFWLRRLPNLRDRIIIKVITE